MITLSTKKGADMVKKSTGIVFFRNAVTCISTNTQYNFVRFIAPHIDLNIDTTESGNKEDSWRTPRVSLTVSKINK